MKKKKYKILDIINDIIVSITEFLELHDMTNAQ